MIANILAVILAFFLLQSTAFAEINVYKVSGFGGISGYVEYNDKTGEIKGLVKKKSGKIVSVRGDWSGLGMLDLCGDNGEKFKVRVEE